MRNIRTLWRFHTMGTLRVVAFVMACVATLMLMAQRGWATGPSTQGIDSLDVDNATVGLPMQTQAASESWLTGLHVSGFLNQTFGMWQNPTALRDYTTSRNNLADSRTWLQVDENYQFDQNNSFFMREWFVYEPPYSFNSANGLGEYANEFYNQYTVRDAWWQNKWGPLTTYVGNQIVVWGQSLAFRVGDVINPTDTTWAFGFANLEQSRIPQWMFHPILNLPEFAGTSANFVETLIIPRYQPMWNSCDYADHRYDGGCNVNAGSVNNGFPGGVSFDPAGRFSSHLTNRLDPPESTFVINPTLPGNGAFPPYGEPLQNKRLILSPINNMFYWCSNAPAVFANPVPVGLRRPCGPGAARGEINVGQWKIPASTFANWTEGARYHTLVGPAELTAFVYDPFSMYPNTYWQRGTNNFRAEFTPEVLTGVTGDMPIPMPSSLSEYLPFVARAVALALPQFPHLNAHVAKDSLTVFKEINLALAVDLDRGGLVAPVIKNVAPLRVPEIARAIAKIAGKARANALRPDDVTGGTYSLTNNGSFGTFITAPVINQPQVAILSIDGVHRRPWVVVDEKGERIEIRPVGVLAHSFDHRAVDGAYSGAYLRAVKQILESREWIGEFLN